MAFNQRPSVASVPPLLHELGLGLTGQSILVTIPVFCFGLGAPAGPYLRRWLGQEWAVFLLIGVLAAAVAVRAVFLGWTLFPATVVVGLCIANLNVLMPAFVKQRFPDHPGPLTSAYVASATLGPAIAAGLTVPVFHAFGGSVNWALGIWVLPALAALAGWSPQLWVARRLKSRERGGSGVGTAAASAGSPGGAPRPEPIWRYALAWQVMVYMGIGSMVFYGPLSWLSQIYQSRGLTPATAGYLLLVMNFVGMIGSTVAPLLMRRRPDVRLGVVVSAIVAMVGFAGLLVGPNSIAFFWIVVLGLGQGGAVRSGSAAHRHPGGRRPCGRAALGDVAVGGYIVAGLGPLVMGGLFSLTDGWTAPIVFLMAANLFGLALGYHAAKERVIRA